MIQPRPFYIERYLFLVLMTFIYHWTVLRLFDRFMELNKKDDAAYDTIVATLVLLVYVIMSLVLAGLAFWAVITGAKRTRREAGATVDSYQLLDKAVDKGEASLSPN